MRGRTAIRNELATRAPKLEEAPARAVGRRRNRDRVCGTPFVARALEMHGADLTGPSKDQYVAVFDRPLA